MGPVELCDNSVNLSAVYHDVQKLTIALCVLELECGFTFLASLSLCISGFIDYCIPWLLKGRHCSSRPTFQILFYAAISGQIDGCLSNSSSIGRMLPLTSAVMLHSEL